jgi:hypothetical protein
LLEFSAFLIFSQEIKLEFLESHVRELVDTHGVRMIALVVLSNFNQVLFEGKVSEIRSLVIWGFELIIDLFSQSLGKLTITLYEGLVVTAELHSGHKEH